MCQAPPRPAPLVSASGLRRGSARQGQSAVNTQPGLRCFPARDPGSDPRTLGQAAPRPRPPRAGRDAPRRTLPSARGPAIGAPQRPMPTRERPQARGSRGRPLGPGHPALVSPGHRAGARRPPCQPPPAPHQARPRKIVFEDELPTRALLGARKPAAAGPSRQTPRPQPVLDYELKYPPLRSERARSRYVAVFQDQYAEFRKLQREVCATQAKLQQLETLLRLLPPPRGQEEARAAAHVWQELEKKRTLLFSPSQDPGFLSRQARCRYLKGKLMHLEAQIQKFDEQADSERSVYF
ncbi:occludin/ELL domain-containing protein 1 [Erethizon dorsatum]